MQSPYPDTAGAGSAEKAAEQKSVKKARCRYRFFAYLLIESRRSRIQGDTPGGRHHPGAAQRFILQVE